MSKADVVMALHALAWIKQHVRDEYPLAHRRSEAQRQEIGLLEVATADLERLVLKVQDPD